MRKITASIIGIVALILIAGIYILQAQSSGKEQSGYTIQKAQISGNAKLVNGSVEVKFIEKDFAKASDIKVVASPIGSWSGIYIKNITATGFTAISETGNANSEFNWIAVGEIKEPPMSIYKDAVPQSSK